jgi:hypothetical protein
LGVGLVIGANLALQQSTKVELIIRLNAGQTPGATILLRSFASAD